MTPRNRPVGVAIGARATNTLGRDGRRELRFPDPRERLGDGRVRRQDDRLRGHHGAGRARQVAQQLPHRVGLVGLHQVEQHVLIGLRQLGEQVGRVVRVHLFEHVGGAGRCQRADDLDLIVLGQLFEHVGEPVVVERGRHLDAPRAGHLLQRVGEVGGPHVVEHGEQRRGALGLRDADEAR